MVQRTSWLLAGIIGAFLLVLAGGLVSAVSGRQPAESAPAQTIALAPGEQAVERISRPESPRPAAFRSERRGHERDHEEDDDD